MNQNVKIMLIAALAILFSGLYASADRGRGCDNYHRMHQGQGWHHRGYGGSGCGALDNLSEDEIKKLDAERTAFFEATKSLRRKIYQKRLELASEVAKEDPDAAVDADDVELLLPGALAGDPQDLPQISSTDA